MRTFKLYYPEWQGYSVDQRVSGGAQAILESLPQADTFCKIDIPMEQTLTKEGNVIGRSAIVENTRRVAESIEQQQPDRILMIGGTCGSELAPVAYINKKYHQGEQRLGVLWFDAHGDMNTPESSCSKRFHGMVLRTLQGEGDSELLNFVDQPLLPEQVIMLGSRDLDPPEVDYIDAAEITVIDPEQFSVDGLIQILKRKKLTHLYIHLDLDFLNPEDFPGMLLPTPGGNTTADFSKALDAMQQEFEVVGFSILEFVPGFPELLPRIKGILGQTGMLEGS